jgi:hypothetical protein
MAAPRIKRGTDDTRKPRYMYMNTLILQGKVSRIQQEGTADL